MAVAAGQSRDPLPVPDIPGFKTLKCDFHIHTVFSDGEVWPTTRVIEAWRDGLDAIALTDHAGHHPHADDLSTDLRRPHQVAKAEAERLGVLLLPGVEFMDGNTHANALFVTDPNAFRDLGFVEAARVARTQNAFVFWNHPGWKETRQWPPLVAAAHAESLIQGVELVNELTFYPEAFPLVADKNLAILANSDIHAPIQADYSRRTRPVTLVFARSADLAGIREALFAHRTAAWARGEMWGADEILRALWDGAAAVENPGLVLAPGAVLRIRNRSALRFILQPVAGVPAWLSAGSGSIEPESVGIVPLHASLKAPPGTHDLTIDWEISNAHSRPGRHPRVRTGIRITIPAPSVVEHHPLRPQPQ